jgi:hypothetical protein
MKMLINANKKERKKNDVLILNIDTLLSLVIRNASNVSLP